MELDLGYAGDLAALGWSDVRHCSRPSFFARRQMNREYVNQSQVPPSEAAIGGESYTRNRVAWYSR